MFACVNENYLTNHKSKFVGFGCDGASNMMGCKTGLTVTVICTGIHGEGDKLPMSFFLSEGNKFHKTRRCSHICHRFYYDRNFFSLQVPKNIKSVQYLTMA
jgi:hypothetical protein